MPKLVLFLEVGLPPVLYLSSDSVDLCNILKRERRVLDECSNKGVTIRRTLILFLTVIEYVQLDD